ncbi:MAG: D-glycerate dehydrogenase [Candidatus Parcubacteria bacterium]|nr:D-glycerate dehydrogenase [Candidatus Parcubacteria bacterium]
MAKVFVTREIPESGLKILKEQGYEVVVGPRELISREDLLKNVVGVDAILSVLTEKINKEVIDAAGANLKIIANFAMGYDNIDVKEAQSRNIYVTNTPGTLTETVAEHAMALILSLAHRIVEADQFTRDGKYKGWGPMLLLGEDLNNKTLGLIGFGAIGQRLAEMAIKGFNMKVIYYDVKPNPEFEKNIGGQFVSLEELLKNSDFVSLHVPLNPQTKHLIGIKELSLMKKTAYLINTARGPVIDENALLNALYTNDIAGAGLDVFEYEPAIVETRFDLREFLKLDNVVLTPHTASASIETRSKMSTMAANNIVATLKGETPLNLIKIN